MDGAFNSRALLTTRGDALTNQIGPQGLAPSIFYMTKLFEFKQHFLGGK